MSKERDAALAGLYAQKLQKLNEQKVLADQMSDQMKKLEEGSRLARKNLQAAIAVSQKPGYFTYYQPTDEVRELEQSKFINGLARKISKVDAELEALTAEIDAAKNRKKERLPEINLTNLHSWFETYGKVDKKDEKGTLLTSFVASPKIFGGTGHHKSFKSVATIMRKGTLTR